MAPPGNGIFVVRGELSTLTTAMRRGARWSGSNSYQDEEQDGLLKPLHELKNILIQSEDLRLIDPNVFLSPFLDIIKSEETTGPVTSLALSAVNKFLSYGLIDPTHVHIATTVENIADAVTHARFVGTDQASDGVVLMKIVQVLRTLMLSPEGSALTNESVCEVMLSCFRICFEPRLNELLRRTAEQALRDMVLLLFMRLPQFVEDRQPFNLAKKLKMIAGSDGGQKKRKSKTVPKIPKVTALKAEEGEQEPISPTGMTLKPPPLATTPATPAGNIVDMRGKIAETPISSLIQTPKRPEDPETPEVVAEGENGKETESLDEEKMPLNRHESVECEADVEDEPDEGKTVKSREEYVNSVGVRFTQQRSITTVLLPYGLPCIRELFRFLISLCNPLDKQNTDIMMHMGLNLLTVALEIGADSIGNYDSLLVLVRDDMCRNLFALLNTERLTIFAADLQVCFLLFESLRGHLKFQLEFYLTKLAEIIGSENPRMPYEIKELALDNMLQLWRIPGFVAELYINFDCDLYCTNLFEDITKLLSKNSLSATQAIHSTHILSLDALLTILEAIKRNCVATKAGNTTTVSRHSRNNSSCERIVIESDVNQSGAESSAVEVENISNYINLSQLERYHRNCEEDAPVSHDQLAKLKNKKRILSQGTELFNSRPEKGILYLQENGLLNPVLDPREVAHFLRENSGLDKKMIGEYISKKKNVESKILETFVKSFDFTNLRIDQALRLYLETFRLPGEAPLIFLVMEHFADHWHQCNGEPFANTDAAFRLAYAIIMLNMDQHNYNAKRLNIPMTVDDFLKNLRGLNGNLDFDQEMLVSVYNSIKSEEIVMPAEQTGIVRENYLWKVLLRRGCGRDGQFHHVAGAAHDRELFRIVWGPTLAALSFMFDKSSDPSINQRAIRGFSASANISAHYSLHEDFDALVLTLCKFTTLISVPEDANEIGTSVAFGQNVKAQLALKCTFGLVHEHGDTMRESWKNILDAMAQLFKLKLLPKGLMEVEDFCEASGRVALVHAKPQLVKSDAGLLSSLYSYLSSDSQRQPSYEEQEIIKVSRKCTKECQVDQIITESKFLQFESLQELLKCLFGCIKPPESHKSVGVSYPEDVTVFLMELSVRILIHNRDRLLPLWESCREPLYQLLIGAAKCGYDYLLNRTIVAILKLAIYLMRNEELCPVVLQSLKSILTLKPRVIFRISRQISTGIYELLKTSAQNIHTEADWAIIFTLLECVGAGAVLVEFEEASNAVNGTKSDGALSSEDDSGLPDRGYTSDSEVGKSGQLSTTSTPLISPTSAENWILVNKDAADVQMARPLSPINTLAYTCKLVEHSPVALVKCWDSLAFIVRNVAHITPYNFESCVRCMRTFVEASLNGGQKTLKAKAKKAAARRDRKRDESTDSEEEEMPERYPTIAIQLLDLMHTLHTRTAQIFRWWAEEGGVLPHGGALWAQGWCPLLQGIARLATDQRRQVRTSAITCLQRALLVHDLQTLSGPEWAGCFKQVLFPLLSDLLAECPAPSDPSLLEESRMRTATIMSKVFLHHLTPLIGLVGFAELWLEILDYIERFMKVGSDMLHEAMLESLKNMLLVMHSVRVFHAADGVSHAPLWDVTWSRISLFLPHLKEELFRDDTIPAATNVQPLQQSPVDSIPTPPKTSIILQPPVLNQEAPPPAIPLLVGRLVPRSPNFPRD
ncbi:Golgi-specific brefeldin A-resistance guanine nucleotide exchange factor 1 isoform X2 [Phlebotomus argentipes]|uniref:Golgi-specific brefeldin A-resistance guanine nucleotide exchange factor 1 isoform X2 n=1 Tax=Phlebotomus argentipes TaxID=94469 RepID=UPI0028933C6F|nr:Golgi-specific brefeldin A-resistance guanine nucleotide exchange factor 1 isoform X2 [Phlebotomus argentipes]